MSGKKRRALKAAFPHTVPILAGFLFLGMAYGIYMASKGFSVWWPMLMGLTIFAGSMQFVTVGLLVSAFDPLYAFFLTLMVNARHLFYGISMLEKFRSVGKKKWYLIFGMCDETFSVNCTATPPDDVDLGWFMFFVTLLNQSYWVIGSALGALIGSVLTFNTQGIDFVMTALFVVIFIDQWMSTKEHRPAAVGIGLSIICLIIFGADHFIIPTMGLILVALTLMRKPLEVAPVQKGGEAA